MKWLVFFNSFEKCSLVYYCVCLVDYENGIPTYGKHVVSDYWNETWIKKYISGKWVWESGFTAIASYSTTWRYSSTLLQRIILCMLLSKSESESFTCSNMAGTYR